MSYLVLVLLSLLWLGFFFPGLLQACRSSSPLNSAATFQESLTRISNGRVVRPEDVEQARRARRSRRDIARQRDILIALSAAFVGAAALGLSFGGVIRWLIVPAGLALGAYIVALRVQATQRKAPRVRRAPRPAVGRAAAPPPGVDEGVVPSVGRRAPAPDPRELERIAG